MIIHRTQNLFADLIMVLFSILIFYYGYTSVGFVSFTTNILQDLMNNFQSKPIVDLKVVIAVCPLEYEPFLKSEWLGTQQACDCSNDFFPNVYARKCKSKGEYFCNNISPIPPVELNIWNSALICVKRHPKNYLYFLNQNNNCAWSGQKSCGKLDGLGNEYCVDLSESCFVSGITISNSEGTIDLGNNKYLSFTTTETETNAAISELKTSEGEPCLDPTQINTSTTPYKIINQSNFTYYCTNNLNGDFQDTRFKYIDTMPIKKFYENNRLTPIISNLPFFTIPTTNLDLYSRAFLGWHQNCVHDEILNPQNLIDSSKILPNLNYAQNIIYYFSIFYLPIAIILIIIKYFGVYEEVDDREASKALKYADGTNFIYVFLSMLSCLVAYRIGTNLLDLFVALKTSNCGDEITNQALAILGEQLESNISKNLISLVLYVLTWILIPLNIIIMYYRGRDNPRENIDEVMNNYIEMKDAVKNENENNKVININKNVINTNENPTEETPLKNN